VPPLEKTAGKRADCRGFPVPASSPFTSSVIWLSRVELLLRKSTRENLGEMDAENPTSPAFADASVDPTRLNEESEPEPSYPTSSSAVAESVTMV
jgi:hypothetical protein